MFVSNMSDTATPSLPPTPKENTEIATLYDTMERYFTRSLRICYCSWPPKIILQNQARKKSTKINFLGPETARWGGGLPREGVVAEKFVPSLESLPWVSTGGIWDVPGFLPGCPRPLAMFKTFVQKKVRSHVSFPNIEPHNPRTTPTKTMMNIASVILGVVYILLFS